MKVSPKFQHMYFYYFKLFLHSLTRHLSYDSYPRTDSQLTAEFCIASLQIQSNEFILGQKPVEDFASEIQSFSTVHKPHDIGDKASNEIIKTISKVIPYVAAHKLPLWDMYPSSGLFHFGYF